tara:strand:- start:5613 stop:6599 length:987 start_codon:yes stop_codon:yes gene_type:complete
MTEHAFAPYVRTLGRGKRARRDLTRDEAAEAMGLILDGQATDAQVGAFLMLLRVKEETPAELAGFLDACRPRCAEQLADLPPVDVDWPSYAGKKKHHPWYLAAARLLAGHGVRILMHGGPAHTPNRRYSDDMLAELGVALPGSVAEAGDQLREDGFTFLDLKHFCAPLAPLLMMRFELGLRSPINTLARSLNPAGAPLSMQSVFHPAYLALHLGASQLCGDRDLLLFKGEGGEPEIRPDARTALTGLRHGDPAEAVLDAALPRQTPPGEVSPLHVRAVWRGEAQDDYGVAAIRGTVATVLWGLEKVDSLEQGLKAAEALWGARDRAAL